MERRRSPRFTARFDTLIAAGAREGAGTLIDISYAGARLEDSSMQPEVGARIRLYVFIQPVAPFEIEGTVSRLTETGFAVSYELFDPEIRRLVDDVVGLIQVPATG